MPPSPSTKVVTISLLGNPNTGKSTLFNALAGTSQQTGNYPGCTVEKKVGRTQFGGQTFDIIDLPGTYSLAPRSPDEMVAVEVLLGQVADVGTPDVVLCIVDASNLERNFYLLSQVLELQRPVVIALNMVDVAQEKELHLDLALLRKQLPVPVVEVQANRGIGVVELKQAIAKAVNSQPASIASPFPATFLAEVQQLGQLAPEIPRYLVERLLLDSSGYLEKSGLPGITTKLLSEVAASRSRLKAVGLSVPGVEAVSRYRWAGEVLAGVVKRPAHRKVTWSDRLDRVLTHRVAGAFVFVALMLLMFQAVFLVAEPASKVIDRLNGTLSGWAESIIAEGALRSLITKGIIEGVGGVLVFVPQIFILFFFIAVLEDCGYMARAAYLMDKLMSRIGLSGKSFIPLLSSFACAVPGIMATRVIENRRDRLVTILIAPLMSCSARLPVYTLLIGAFVPPIYFGPKVFGFSGILSLHGLVMFAMYALGMITGIAVALILKKTILKGATPPFVMELPSYKVPGVKIVLSRMFEQGWAFVRRAGTLILAVSIIVWGLAYYPHQDSTTITKLRTRQAALETNLSAIPPQDDSAQKQELAKINNLIAGEYLSSSYLGQIGHAIEPAVKPLGWDWRIGCAAIASFPAREVVIASLGVIYNLGEGIDEKSPELATTLQNATWEGTDRKVITTPVALSIMVFFALCAQCASTLVVMRRETGDWRWPAFTFVYMTTLAYIGAFLTYQIGRLL